jgi:hypothetical protein
MSVALTRQTSLLEQLLQATINPAYDEIGDSAQAREWRLLTSPGRRPSPGSELCSAAWQVNLIRRRNRPRSQLWFLTFASLLIAIRPQNVLSETDGATDPANVHPTTC